MPAYHILSVRNFFTQSFLLPLFFLKVVLLNYLLPNYVYLIVGNKYWIYTYKFEFFNDKHAPIKFLPTTAAWLILDRYKTVNTLHSVSHRWSKRQVGSDIKCLSCDGWVYDKPWYQKRDSIWYNLYNTKTLTIKYSWPLFSAGIGIFSLHTSGTGKNTKLDLLPQHKNFYFVKYKFWRPNINYDD